MKQLEKFSKAYIVFLVLTFIAIAEASCPNLCSNRGQCDKFSRCICADGFMGADCSLRKCPYDNAWSDYAYATNKAHAPAECSNRGLCDRSSGKCSCITGYTGIACERLDCEGSCNGNGKCLTMHDRSVKMRDSNSKQYSYTNVWDANKVMGCNCDNRYSGYDCSIRTCPSGDDPLSKNQVNEIQLLKCVAISGRFVLYYKGVPSDWIPYTANAAMVKKALLAIPILTNVDVTFSLPTSPVCSLLSNIVKIEFTEQFGRQPPLVPQLDEDMLSKSGFIVVSADGLTSLVDDSQTIFTSVKGNKESESCANRGYCSTTDGICACYNTNGDAYASSNGYGSSGSRGDCGYVTSGSTVSSCPGAISCSDHGVCTAADHRCSCEVNYRSGDCSVRVCPTGLSWYDYMSADDKAHITYTTCSDMGLCDPVLGVCSCRANFFGQACEYMSCDAAPTGSPHCSGNGRCLSMTNLALLALNNGDATSFTYGTDPNNPFTWDGGRIFGCHCDEGYSGYDCSLRDCPAGDDPGTYDDHVEVQLLQCKANSGVFRLSFRRQTTGPIGYNATAAVIKRELERLKGVRKVSVYFIQDGRPPPHILHHLQPLKMLPEGAPQWGNFSAKNRFQYNVPPVNTTYHPINTPVCDTNGGQVAIVSFDAVHGDLPAMTADVSNLIDTQNGNGLIGSGSVKIYQDGETVLGVVSIRGTTENAPCNNRGLCNQVTGQCSCFDGWSSSDGEGNPGFLNDCGYRSREI